MRKTKAKPDAQSPEDENDVHRLTEMDTQYVSLVGAGANRQTSFFVVKSADGTVVPSVEGVDATAAKAVPADDATPEDKRAAQDARATHYGIQALDGGEANLSFPADAPTSEALYGDPVNLKYPLGGADNAVDPARVRNALARFKQASTAYSEAASRTKVYSRIVEAALTAGIDVGFDPEDPIDAALPADLRDRLQAKSTNDAAAGTAPAAPPAGTATNGGEGNTASKAQALAPWLETASARVQTLAMDAAVTKALAPPLAPEIPPVASVPSPVADPSAHAELKAQVAASEAALRKERDRTAALEADLAKARESAQRAAEVATAELRKAQTALVTERARVAKLRLPVVAHAAARHPGETADPGMSRARAVSWAGDLAAQIRDEESSARGRREK